MFPIMISDSDANKWGKDVCGYKVVSPDELLERKDEYDKIIISSWYYYGSIKKDLLKLGIAASELSMGEYNAN